jgi:hypothetical protein
MNDEIRAGGVQTSQVWIESHNDLADASVSRYPSFKLISGLGSTTPLLDIKCYADRAGEKGLQCWHPALCLCHASRLGTAQAPAPPGEALARVLIGRHAKPSSPGVSSIRHAYRVSHLPEIVTSNKPFGRWGEVFGARGSIFERRRHCRPAGRRAGPGPMPAALGSSTTTITARSPSRCSGPRRDLRWLPPGGKVNQPRSWRSWVIQRAFSVICRRPYPWQRGD